MLALPRRLLLRSLSTHSYAYTYQLTSPWTIPTTTSRHPLSNNSTFYRYLSSTPPLSKKKDKSKPSAPEPTSNTNTSTKSKPTSEDPEDLSSVETGIANAVNRLRDELSKLRAGGRVNTEVIEGLKVNLKTGSGNGNESVRLGELAQVVPRGGRMSAVLVSEEEVSYPLFEYLLFMGICLRMMLMWMTAHQTNNLRYNQLQSLSNTPTGCTQQTPTQHPHPPAYERIAGSECECGAGGVGTSCEWDP